jgi:hypothetical protein
VNAIGKYLGAKDEIFVGGEQMKATDVAALYQDALDTRSAAVTAKGDYKSALAGRDAAEDKRLAADVALESYVVQRFGATSTQAHDFGFAPKKVAGKSAVTKAKAVLQGQATREARGTTSKKAKQQIKGTLSPAAAAALEALAGQSAPAAPVAASPVAAPVAALPVAVPPATLPVAAPAVAAPVAPVANGVALNGSAHS